MLLTGDHPVHWQAVGEHDDHVTSRQTHLAQHRQQNTGTVWNTSFWNKCLLCWYAPNIMLIKLGPRVFIISCKLT